METFPGDPLRRAGRSGSSEDFLRLLDRAVAASANGILITDQRIPDNPIIYVNPAFERTTGYTRAEVVGRNCRFLQCDDRDQPVLDDLRECIRTGSDCRVVLRNYRKDGKQFWNELYVSPVHNDRGELTHFVGVQNDITERKRAEEERDLLLVREQIVREQIVRAEAVEARKRLSMLAAAGSALSSTSLDYGATLGRIPRLVVPDLGDFCLVDILEENGEVLQIAADHADPEKLPFLKELRRHRRFELDSPGAVARVLHTGEPVLLGEVSEDYFAGSRENEKRLELLGKLEMGSLISAPLVARGRTLGAITVAASRGGRRYDEDDLSLLGSLAYRCALALDNARLYRERGRIARTLQRSLLPRLPETPGIEVGMEYLPVGEETEIGGDFYDLIEAPDGSWIATIGDVRGHGPLAAALTALARYTIRAIALREGEPARLLSGLNEALLRQVSSYRFLTAACARLSETGGDGAHELKVSVAGHPPPLVLRRDGSVQEISVPSKVLGVFEEPELGESTLRLSPGEAVVLYTDGVTEAHHQGGDLFGEERLRSLLGTCTGLKAPEISGRLKEAVLDHASGQPRDDIAILVVRVPG
jgi:PAS domain S-box-containing protein